MRALLLALCLLTTRMASAGALVDINVFYYSDSFTYSSVASSYSRLLWDLCVGMALSKKGNFVLGWNYDSMSFTDSPSGNPEKLTVSDMGPKIIYYLDKARTLPVAFTYDLITKGNYTPSGGTAVELRGSAMKAEFGYTPEISDGLLLGFKINYYKPNFSESVVSSTITKTTNSHAVIYPSFALTFRWD